MAKYATFRPQCLSYVPKGTKPKQTQFLSWIKRYRDGLMGYLIKINRVGHCLEAETMRPPYRSTSNVESPGDGCFILDSKSSLE